MAERTKSKHGSLSLPPIFSNIVTGFLYDFIQGEVESPKQLVLDCHPSTLMCGDSETDLIQF